MGVLLICLSGKNEMHRGTILLLRHAPQIYGFAGGGTTYLVDWQWQRLAKLSRAFWIESLVVYQWCEEKHIFLWLLLIDPGPGKVATRFIKTGSKGASSQPSWWMKERRGSPSPVSPHLCRVDRSTPAAQTNFWPIGPSLIGDRTAAP